MIVEALVLNLADLKQSKSGRRGREREKGRETETDRETDRETETGRQAGRQTDRQTDRQKNPNPLIKNILAASVLFSVIF